MNFIEFEGFARQGWQCPLCKRVYSPDTSMCFYCGNGGKDNFVYGTSTTGIFNVDIDEVKKDGDEK